MEKVLMSGSAELLQNSITDEAGQEMAPPNVHWIRASTHTLSLGAE
jgi:hypothetical protein